MHTVTVDDYKRVRIASAKPGQVFAVEDDGGRVTLTPVKEAEPKVFWAKLVRKAGELTFELPKGAEGAAEGISEAIRQAREEQAERACKP